MAGRVDRGHPVATEADFEAFRQQHGYHDFIATSSKTGEGIKELRDAIRQAIPWERLRVTSSPELWKRIREYLLQRRNGQHVLTTRHALRDAFRRQHKGMKFTWADFDTVVGHAQAQGLIWRLSFGDFVLMKPELLNSYAASVVRVARNHPDGLGCVAERDILDGRIDFEDLERLPRETERKLLYAVVELFLDREIALRGGLSGELIVFPSKFNRKLPIIPEPPLREVAYRFKGAIEDIYATLSVRLVYSDAFELKDLWKNAAEFRDARDAICGFELQESDDGEGIISAFFETTTSLSSKVLFLRFIHEHLRQRAIPNSVCRERIYRCAKCGWEVSDHRIVQRRLERGEEYIRCLDCDEKVPLMDLIEEKFADPKLVQRIREIEKEVTDRKDDAVGVTVADAKKSISEFDVFLAHNTDDRPQVEEIAQALRRRGVNPWLDKEQIPPGRWFQDVIQQAIRKVKSAAIIIGLKGLGRWQVVELRSFISQCVERDIPVIPVLLPGVKEIPEKLTFLGDFTSVKFAERIDDPEAYDNLVWGITGVQPWGDARPTPH